MDTNNHAIDSDPFEVLRVSYRASDEEVVQARDALLRSGEREQSEVLLAYSRIRNQRLRDDFCFTDFRSILFMPKSSAVEVDTTALVQELAFLSPWEVGVFDKGAAPADKA